MRNAQILPITFFEIGHGQLAVLFDAIFLTTCNAILFLRDTKLANPRLYYAGQMFLAF